MHRDGPHVLAYILISIEGGGLARLIYCRVVVLRRIGVARRERGALDDVTYGASLPEEELLQLNLLDIFF